MEISATLVKTLREKTGVGLMNCKKALTDTNGDLDAAIKALREKGLATASKKADRSAAEGRLFIHLSNDNQQAVILELNCETDFVANNDAFKQLGADIATAILENSSITHASSTTDVTIKEKSLQDYLSSYVLQLGENLSVSRFKKITSDTPISSYLHMNGKIGTLVSFSGSADTEIAKSIAMHVAASAPLYLNSDDVPQEEIDTEKNIIRAQAKNEGRPDPVIEKIVEGKISKFFKENCLVEQVYIKDDKQVIKNILPKDTTISDFVRLEIGQ